MKRVATAIVLGVIVGCIIIPSKHEINAHIQLDIRLERDATQILDFIEGKTDELPPAVLDAKKPEEKTSKLIPAIKTWVMPIQTAYAQELKNDSAKARELAMKLRERRPAIDDLKNKGYVGEDNRGYLALRDHEDLKDAKKKNEVQRMIHEENKDRKDLYKEIVDQNRENRVTLSQVERVFARAYRQRAQSGHWIQLPENEEDLQEFKASPVGKKLGELRPGAWVQIP